MLIRYHFYPRSPCGERHTHPITILVRVVISIHALLAESDWLELFLYYQDNRFLSTLSLRRATTLVPRQYQKNLFLSTLSLRRATSNESSEHTNNGNFYPRSPCGERQNARPEIRQLCAISIHALLAESDRQAFYGTAQHTYFYPRSPCGERLMHALELAGPVLFLSTLSLRRATASVA